MESIIGVTTYMTKHNSIFKIIRIVIYKLDIIKNELTVFRALL